MCRKNVCRRVSKLFSPFFLTTSCHQYLVWYVCASVCMCACACVCKRYTHLRVTWRLLLINAAPPSLEGCSQTVSAECLKCSAMGFSLFFFFPVLFENLMAQLGRVDYTGQQRKCYEPRGCGLRVSFEILA